MLKLITDRLRPAWGAASAGAAETGAGPGHSPSPMATPRTQRSMVVLLLTRQRPDPAAGLLGRLDARRLGAGRDVFRERRRAAAGHVHAQDLLGRAQPPVCPELVPDPEQLAG